MKDFKIVSIVFSEFLNFYTLILLVFISNLASSDLLGNKSPSFLPGGDFSKFAIPEDTPVGTVIYRLKGSDPENGELTYSISGEYFRVNKKTGDITLIKALDRENEASIDVIISLTDDGNGVEPETVSLRRTLLITDINDNPPIFSHTPYSFRVSESAPLGSTLFSSISVSDDDFGPHASITLECDKIKTPLACETFGVSGEEIGEGNVVGIVSLKRPLDYEEKRGWSLGIVARDGENEARSVVSITVTDVQDQSPRFIGGPYVFKVRENSAKGTRVGKIQVQDGDTGSPRDVQIKLIDDANNNYFILSDIEKDPFSGIFTGIILTTENLLDAEDEFIRENLGVYELTLEAREIPLNLNDTEPTLVTRVGLAVMIQDVDDNIPLFTPPVYTQLLKVPFSKGGERHVFPDFEISVEDIDEEKGHATFDLAFNWSLSSEHDINEIFGFVTPSPPEVRSKSLITLLVHNTSLLAPGLKFNLEIHALAHGTLLSKINIPVEVESAKSNIPVFNSTIFRVSVGEDVKEGEVISEIRVKNGGQLDGVNYALIGVGAEKFDLDEKTGELRCKVPKCVDYEKEKSHFFLIRALSGSKVDEETYALFYLDILPRNDEPPQFESNSIIRRSVPDGSMTFDPPFIIKAKDMDKNDHVTYELEDVSMNSSGIYIDKESGEIKLGKRLKWSEAGEHKLSVLATDESGKSAHLSILLIVQPLLNIPPYFPYEKHSIQIPESTLPGSSILLSPAHDPDGQDSALRYYIDSQPEDDLFSIDEISGTLSLNKGKKLDFEGQRNKYGVVLRVEDEGKPKETARALIEITVTDVNDEIPEFPVKNIVVDLSESAKIDELVLTLEGSDSDADSKLEYDFSCPCSVWDSSGSLLLNAEDNDVENIFSIDKISGEIKLKKTLEHKKTAVIEFLAHVFDRNAKELQNNSATVTVFVTAAERLLPYFGEPWTPTNPWINLTIPEDMTVGSNVVTLNAWDYVADEEISDFSLVDEESGDPFVLEENILRILTPLDYETKKNFVVLIKATDGRGGESMAHLAIEVTDTNDHDPVFSKPEYKGKVVENSEFPTPILTVEASDRDDVQNYGAIRFSLNGPFSNLFTIDSLAGVVQVAPDAVLDREKNEFVHIYVVAKDTPGGGPFQRSATASLKIQITDLNDNEPVCGQKEEFIIPEDSPIGTLVGNITCTDPDKNTNLIHKIVDDTKLGLFSINPATGSITVTNSLRARGRSAPYSITVETEDGPHYIISTLISIKIANNIPNDGKPHFFPSPLIGEVSEGAFRGTPIIHIKAIDSDSFDNGEGRLTYKLLKQSYPCAQKLTNERRGGEKLTNEGGASEKLANGGAGGEKLSNGGGANEKLVNEGGASEELTNEGGASEKLANEGGASDFSTNERRGVEDVNYFKLDEVSGMLSLVNPIDREVHECIRVLVAVEDLGVPPRMNSEWVTINVLDIDDSLPTLPLHMRLVNLFINESTPKSTQIFQFTAHDSDIYPNNLVSFELSGSNGAEFFKLVPLTNQSAALVVSNELALLEKDEILLNVKCMQRERRVPLPECNSKVSVRIRRDFENSERLTSGEIGKKKSEEMIMGVASGVPVGNLIGNIGMNNFKESPQMFHPNQISLTPTPVTQILKIDPSSGDILVWDNLEPYSNGHLRLEVNNYENGLEGSGRKKLKIFIGPNSELLQTETGEVGKIAKWREDVENFLNKDESRMSRGVFKLLTFDMSSGNEGKTTICFQLLENENMISQEKSLQLLTNPDIQDIFLKYTFGDEIQKGCPERATGAQKLVLGGSESRFWVERSLVGIASVVAIATLSFITILCLVNRSSTHRREKL